MGESAFDFDVKFPIDAEAKTIVLVGKTGNGKSATGNSIIGADVFDSMPSLGGVTATCQMRKTVLADGQILNVIDTPGLFDSSVEPKSIGNEIAKCITMAKNGIHAVLVVVSLGVRYSLEEASAIESLRQFFGGKIGDYMILVFTHGDALRKMSLDDFLARNCPEPLEKTLRLCGNRRVLFDNMTQDEVKKSQQLRKLLRLVDTVVENNDGVPYTNELFVESPDISGNGFNKACEEQMNGFLEKIESKIQETTLMLEKQLAEERSARMEAEAKAREAQMKLSNEMRQLALEKQFAAELQKNQAATEYKFKETELMFKMDLERARRDAEELQKKQAETENKFKETELKFKETEDKLKETEYKLSKKWGCVIS